MGISKDSLNLGTLNPFLVVFYKLYGWYFIIEVDLNVKKLENVCFLPVKEVQHVLSSREGFTTYGHCTPATCTSMHRRGDLSGSKDVCC